MSFIGAVAGYDAHYANTRQDKPRSLYPVCTHPITVSPSQPAVEHTRERKNMSHSQPTKPQARLFLTSLSPAASTQGHHAYPGCAWRALPQMFSPSFHFCDPQRSRPPPFIAFHFFPLFLTCQGTTGLTYASGTDHCYFRFNIVNLTYALRLAIVCVHTML